MYGLVLGGLLSFLALVAMAYTVNKSQLDRKEKRMKKRQAKNEKPTIIGATLNTIWAIGTSTWSGVALLG